MHLLFIVSELLKLTRISSCIITFLAVFAPLTFRTSDYYFGIKFGLPILFMGICTFIANDVSDIEKDKINHPERPLPAGKISINTAVTVYLLSLTGGLATTKLLIPDGMIFLYLSFFY